MFRRILVPLDGTARAEQALPVAARLARASGGTVVLLRVVNPLSELAPYYQGLTVCWLSSAQQECNTKDEE
jgi:nucleotide-binding universal stress UspA family protein